MGIIAGNEPDTSNINNMPIGLYYYYINKNKINEANYLGWVSTINSLTYNPFIDESDLSLYVNNFDTNRYGSPSGGIPKCYRIVNNDRIEKDLFTFKVFPNKSEMNFQNDDIKMYCYPFRYFIITDYINTPLIIKPELVETYSDGTATIKVVTAPLSSESKYNLYIKDYKGDYYGNLEGIVNNNALMLPVSSSAYAQFLATSSSSFHQGNVNAMLENDITLKQGTSSLQLAQYQNIANNTMGGIGSLLSGNLGGVLSSVSNGVFGYLQNNMEQSFLNENHSLKENAITSMAMAKVSDMLTTPKSMLTCGNDTLFNLINGRNKIDLIEYRPHFRKRTMLVQYLKRYGYYMNSYDIINLNTKKYYNYYKTIVCNIKGANIPHADLDEIKQIFNSGVTFWNVETGVRIGDYNVNNEEV